MQFCGPSGADAVEAAVKLAKTATGRGGLIAFGGAYHGMTQATMALSGAHAPKQPLGLLGAEVAHLPFPASYRCPFGVGGRRGAELCARMLEWTLTDGHSGVVTPAAVLIEPIQGEGGVQPAPAPFLNAVRRATADAGVLLIADEVQTGLGRTGTLWASERLEPDILVLSKAIGGGLPLALIVYRPELDVWAPGRTPGRSAVTSWRWRRERRRSATWSRPGSPARRPPSAAAGRRAARAERRARRRRGGPRPRADARGRARGRQDTDRDGVPRPTARSPPRCSETCSNAA